MCTAVLLCVASVCTVCTGDTQVSAVTREGFDDLLETLLLQAEVLELRADNKVRERRTLLEISSGWLLLEAWPW